MKLGTLVIILPSTKYAGSWIGLCGILIHSDDRSLVKLRVLDGRGEYVLCHNTIYLEAECIEPISPTLIKKPITIRECKNCGSFNLTTQSEDDYLCEQCIDD